MNFPINYHDYRSVHAAVRGLGRAIDQDLRHVLPGLLGHRMPQGLAAIPDSLRRGSLAQRQLRMDIAEVLEACDRTIEDATTVQGEWFEAGYSDGGIDWAWRETKVLDHTAQALVPIRNQLRKILDLLERMHDLNEDALSRPEC